MDLNTITEKVLSGEDIDKETALFLYNQPLEDLCKQADNIRKHFCQDNFDICTIVNAKSGHCSENCKFCAQSAFNHTGAAEYPLLDKDEILSQAKRNHDQGILRYSIVTSGKRVSDQEVDEICKAIEEIKEKVGIGVCVSMGLLNEDQFRRLKKAGASRVHNNLETSKGNFPNICTTHTFKDKVETIYAAKRAGLTVCSGGIMGIGESVEDRIDMAFTLRELGIKSVPVNMLNPIPGTPLENIKRLTVDDMRRIIAVYRFILPTASIRLAGGRGLMEDKGKSCFLSGANAAISGDMLTTSGISMETDMKLLDELGYKVVMCNE